VRSTEVD